MTSRRQTLAQLADHNLDALLAIAALPLFALAGWPLSGWFWATAVWAVNRYLSVVVERRAARAGRCAASACWARACSCGRGSACWCCS